MILVTPITAITLITLITLITRTTVMTLMRIASKKVVLVVEGSEEGVAAFQMRLRTESVDRDSKGARCKVCAWQVTRDAKWVMMVPSLRLLLLYDVLAQERKWSLLTLRVRTGVSKPVGWTGTECASFLLPPSSFLLPPCDSFA